MSHCLLSSWMVNSVKVSHHATYPEYLDSMKALIFFPFWHFHSCLGIEEEVKRRKRKGKKKGVCSLSPHTVGQKSLSPPHLFSLFWGQHQRLWKWAKENHFLYRMQNSWFKLCATSSSAKSFNSDNSLTGASAVDSKKQAWLYLLPFKGRQLRGLQSLSEGFIGK